MAGDEDRLPIWFLSTIFQKMIITARKPKRTPKAKPKALPLPATIVSSKSPAEVKRLKRIERLRDDAVKR